MATKEESSKRVLVAIVDACGSGHYPTGSPTGVGAGQPTIEVYECSVAEAEELLNRHQDTTEAAPDVRKLKLVPTIEPYYIFGE